MLSLPWSSCCSALALGASGTVGSSRKSHGTVTKKELWAREATLGLMADEGGLEVEGAMGRA